MRFYDKRKLWSYANYLTNGETQALLRVIWFYFTAVQKRTLRQYLKKGKRVNPKIILDAFILAVGSSGTLLLPLFNLDFTKGISFDLKYSPSQMGALTEAPGVHPFHPRIGHRIYSFAAIEYEAKRLWSLITLAVEAKIRHLQYFVNLTETIAVLILLAQNRMSVCCQVVEMNNVAD